MRKNNVLKELGIDRTRLISVKTPRQRQTLTITWSPHLDGGFKIYTDCEALAKVFALIAEENGIAYCLYPMSFAATLPKNLIPFKLPFKKAYSITKEERQRRADWCRQIAQISIRNRRKRNA